MNETRVTIPLEIVVAITAAVSAVIEQPVGSFVVTSVEPERLPHPRSSAAWAKSGVMESHLARRQFGLRTR